MPKLTPDDLQKIKEKMKKVINIREGEWRAKVTVHMGTCGIAAWARKIMSALLEKLEEKNIKDVIVTTSGCAGLCSREPMITVEIKGKPPVKYVDLTEEKIKRIVEEHIISGNIIVDYALSIGSEQVP